MNNHRPRPSSGMVFKIQKYAIHDGPGIRTTVFFKGCPLQCRWCHNPESISAAVEAIRTRDGREETVGRMMTVSEVVAEIEKDRIFYEESGGGVTLSGGEPLMQADFARDLARTCAERDLHVALDTCGHGDRAALDRILLWVDLVLFDLKFADTALHRQHTGVDNDLILANLHHLDAGDVPYRIRFPVIPGITDTPAALEQLARTLAGLHRRPAIDLLAYHPAAEAKYDRLGLEYPLRGLQPPAAEQMDRIAARLNRQGFKTHMGG